MLSFNQSHLNELASAREAHFEAQLLLRLRQRHAELLAQRSDDELRAGIARMLRKARSFGLVYELDLWRFMEFVMIYGMTLDERADEPWIGATLRRSDIDGTVKMDFLDSIATFGARPTA